MSLNRVRGCLRLLGILVRHVQENMFRPLPFVSLLLNISFRWHQRIEQNWQSKFAELHEQASWSLEVLWCLRIYLISSVLRLVHFSFRFVLKKKNAELWDFFSFVGTICTETLPKESFLARSRQVRRTVEFAGKLLSRKQRDRCWVLGSAQPT